MRQQGAQEGQKMGPSSSSGRELSGGYLVCLCAVLSVKLGTGGSSRRLPVTRVPAAASTLQQATLVQPAESSIFPKK